MPAHAPLISCTVGCGLYEGNAVSPDVQKGDGQSITALNLTLLCVYIVVILLGLRVAWLGKIVYWCTEHSRG